MIGAPLALYIGTMKRCDSQINEVPQPIIEVAGAPDPDQSSWEEACAYVADCLVDIMAGRVAEQDERVAERKRNGPGRAI